MVGSVRPEKGRKQLKMQPGKCESAEAIGAMVEVSVGLDLK